MRCFIKGAVLSEAFDFYQLRATEEFERNASELGAAPRNPSRPDSRLPAVRKMGHAAIWVGNVMRVVDAAPTGHPTTPVADYDSKASLRRTRVVVRLLGALQNVNGYVMFRARREDTDVIRTSAARA